MKVIDFQKAIEKSKQEKIEKKIKSYENNLHLILDIIDEMLDDMEESDINWAKVTREQREKIEAIATLGLMAETYAGWVKE
tara:strand:- start:63 stop:305 length:243 start_codon:yes stop_codon:yes gene_type:complete